jgi:O-antigen/teichoic acid export membrane protein
VEGEDSIRRNAGFAFLVNMSAAVFTAALTLFLVRALGPEGYGLYALALSIAALLILVSDLGISTAAARFVAERRGDRDAVGAIVADALRLKVVIALTVSTALFIASGPVAEAYDQPALDWPLRAIAVVLFAQSLLQLIGGTFAAHGRMLANLKIGLSSSAVELGTVVPIVLLGGGAAGAAFGRAAGWFVALAVGLVELARWYGRAALGLSHRSAGTTRRIAGYAGALLLVEAAYALFDQIGTILIGGYIGASAVGVFQAPMRLVALLHLPALAVAVAVAPRLASHERLDPNVPAFQFALRWLIVLQAATIAPLLVWAEPIVDVLLGAEYEESANLLRALTPYIFLTGLAPLLSLAANYLGRARSRVPFALGALLVCVVLDVVLIPRIGVIGAAIGSVGGFAVYVLGHLWICRGALGFPLVPVAVTTGRSLLAAALAAATLAVFGVHELAVWEWLAGGSLATAVFFGTLLATKEVSRSDLAEVVLIVRRAIGARVRGA